MAVVRVFPGGVSGGFPGSGQRLTDTKRGEIKGWTQGASRRLVAWLWSIDPSMLGDNGWALTFTMGHTPDNSQQWHSARKALMKRLQRSGVTAQHWVIEWTAIGRPHLHMAVYGDTLVSSHAMRAWLAICADYGWDVEPWAQHFVKIDGAPGWLEYLAKHASRGVRHYQRQGKPEGWDKTGRLWGHWGDWPTSLPVEVDLNDESFWRFRRLARSYLAAKMRARSLALFSLAGGEADPDAAAALLKSSRRIITAARRIGSNAGHAERGRYIGLSGWVPESDSVTLINASLVESRLEKLEREEPKDECCNHCHCRRQRREDQYARSHRTRNWREVDVYVHACRWRALHRQCPSEY